jgi:uncharacterized protein YndB with AHSA1/START domain
MIRTAFFWLTLCSIALSQQTLESGLIEKAEACAASYVNHKATLPDKWATYVRYRIQNAPDAEKQRYTEGSQLFAEWMSKKAKYGEIKFVDRFLDGSNSNYMIASMSPSKSVHFDGNNWTTIRSFPSRDFPDPFALICSGSSFDFGLDEQDVFLCFFGPKRACLRAFERDGDLCGVWGTSKPDDTGSWSVTVRFSKNELPIEVVLSWYEKWNPRKLDAPHRVDSRTTLEWTFDKDHEVYVPIAVEAIDCHRDDRNREFEFRLEWKFNDDVPDGLFDTPKQDDPRKHPVPKPQFSEKGIVKF